MARQRVWIMIALVPDAVIAVTGVIAGPGFNMTGLLGVGPPDRDAAVKRVVRLLLEHSGAGLTDDVLLVLGEPLPARDIAAV